MLDKHVGLTTGTGLRHRLRTIHCDAIIWPALLTGVFCLLTFQVASAGVTGSISGIVTDQSDAVVAGAEVTAHSVETGIERVVVTDQKGFYSFLALPVGAYTISVRKDGFNGVEAGND